MIRPWLSMCRTRRPRQLVFGNVAAAAEHPVDHGAVHNAEPDDLGSDDPDHDELLDDVDEAGHPPSSSRQTRPRQAPKLTAHQKKFCKLNTKLSLVPRIYRSGSDL